MAERGGYRRPSERSPTAPGIGRNSKRTDRQAIRSPNVQEGSDLTQGDRERIRQGQKVAPLSRTPTPQIPTTRTGPTQSPALGGAIGALPEHLMSIPSTRPNEPETEGLPIGPGAGPEVLRNTPDPDDDKEFVLSVLAGPPFNNQAVADMLRDYRDQKIAAQTLMPQATPVEPSLGDLDESETSPEPEAIEMVPPTEEVAPEETEVL